MLSLKRVLRVALPSAVLALGATVYAHTRSNDCANPSLLAKAMQATGMARIRPCELLQLGDGLSCLDPGRHCNVGNGSGKCQNLPIGENGNLVCQCVPNH